jgi:flagellar P-ring protein precursor FlgI
VTGLAGTGDTSNFAKQQISNLAKTLGIVVSPTDLNSNNVAFVNVEATLRPYAQPGQTLDCFVSSYGDAKSLTGGRLLRTPLYGSDPDRAVAVASGAIVLGGFQASGQAATVKVNHTTSGAIPAGAQVEEYAAVAALMRPVTEGNAVHLDLRDPEPIVAARIADAVNAEFPDAARATTPGTVRVAVLPGFDERGGRFPAFLGRLLDLTIVAFERARVLVDEKTATVLVTGSPRLSACLIARGNLTITIAETPEVSQPGPFAPTGAQTTTVPRTEVTATQATGRLVPIGGAATLTDLASALNALGATPRDLIEILAKLRSAGALHAEIVNY